MKYIVLLLCCAWQLAAAQIGGVHNHGSSAFLTPEQAMPKGVIHVDKTKMPADQYGYNYDRWVRGCQGVSSYDWATCGSGTFIPTRFIDAGLSGGDSSFRIICQVAKYRFDDPIVKPGAPGTSHGHVFFGNTTTDAHSDPAHMADVGRSTCRGGTINRTGYWTPFPVYHCPNPVVGCDGSREGETIIVVEVNAYYKTQVLDTAHNSALNWFPDGFRMVGGNPSNEDPNGMHGRFDCVGGNGTTPVDFDGNGKHIPTTAQATAIDTGGSGCAELNMLVDMPTCWNGVDLYLPPRVGAPDMSGHVAYRGGAGGCDLLYPGTITTPATAGVYPKDFPNIGFNVHFKTAIADYDWIRLTSDKAEITNTTGAGSTTTVIKLNVTENQVNAFYVGGFIFLNGEKRTISGYSAVGPTVTVSSAFSTAPASGVTYYARSLAGRSVHADWANGWKKDPNFLGSGKTVGQMITDNCHRDPAHPEDRFDCHNDIIGNPGDGWWYRLF